MNLRRNRGWGAKLGGNNVNIILTWNSQKIKNNFFKKNSGNDLIYHSRKKHMLKDMRR